MTKISRIAFALPLCALVAFPASAQNFFSFQTTFSGSAGNFVFSGTTAPGQATYGGSGFTFGSILANGGSLTLNGQTIFPYVGLVNNTNGDNFNFNGLTQSIVFSDAGSGSFHFSVGGSSLDNTVQSRSLYFTLNDSWQNTSGNQPFYYITSNDAGVTSLWTGNQSLLVDTGYIPNNITGHSGRAQSATVSNTNVNLVPEINGSGYAYIAFILGALGLWLYSGAGRGRQEETPALA
jgi:hypothetical protein